MSAAPPKPRPDIWKCDTCGTVYGEYVNGCPHCGTVGIRSRVESI
jgi:rubrerythrin